MDDDYLSDAILAQAAEEDRKRARKQKAVPRTAAGHGKRKRKGAAPIISKKQLPQHMAAVRKTALDSTCGFVCVRY